MKKTAGYKFSLFLATVLTAAVLCTLPFLLVDKDTIYIYTAQPKLSSNEDGFIRELNNLHIKTVINPKTLPKKNEYALWLKSPDNTKDAPAYNRAEINFIYSDNYYPISGKVDDPETIYLTPYQDLFEHYMRSNMKSAVFSFGVNAADFYASEEKKKYRLLYYGDNNKVSPPAEYLLSTGYAKFLGTNWQGNPHNITIDLGSPEERRNVLAACDIVVIYNAPETPASKIIPNDALEAIASGALLFSSPNKALSAVYDKSVVFYNTPEEIPTLAAYYLNNRELLQEKTLTAQKITSEKFNTRAAAIRFKEILDWLKKNKNN